MSRSRSCSPERNKPKYTRATVLEKIRQLFQPFQHWAEHILLNKITLRDDFVVDKHGRNHSYVNCLWKMTKVCWNSQMKLPRDENPVDNFILLCITMPGKYHYNFQIYYWHFLTHVLKIEMNWWFIRYRVLKGVGCYEEFPASLLNVLQYSPPSLSVAPNQLNGRQLKKIQRCIVHWEGSNYANDRVTPYDLRRAQIQLSCQRALTDMPFFSSSSDLAATHGPLCSYCYKAELQLDELPRPRQLAVIFKASGYTLSLHDFASGFMAMLREGKLSTEERAQFEASLQELKVPAYKIEGLKAELNEELGL